MREDVLILCYHAVSRSWPASLSVTPDRLAYQLEFLVRRGYRGATFTAAVTEPQVGRTLAVTFDDGFRSVVKLAWPIMQRLGLPGTVFVATDHVGTEKPMAWSGLEQWLGTEHEPELTAASWPELAELERSGWEIGAHTRSHPHLTQVADERLPEELSGSRNEIENHLGGECTSLAYPYGDHNQRVVAAASAAGFRVAAALPSHLYGPEPLRWPRTYIAHQDDARRFRLKISRPVRRARVTGRAVLTRLGSPDRFHEEVPS